MKRLSIRDFVTQYPINRRLLVMRHTVNYSYSDKILAQHVFGNIDADTWYLAFRYFSYDGHIDLESCHVLVGDVQTLYNIYRACCEN